MERVEHRGQRDAFAAVTALRTELYSCLLSRGDALFELCDALLCTDSPVRTLVDFALAPEHRRGHGALNSEQNQSRIDVARLRRALVGVPLPQAAEGRLPRLRPGLASLGKHVCWPTWVCRFSFAVPRPLSAPSSPRGQPSRPSS
ncbi:transposase [Streptomyces sp. E11-3]|uniref:transposase n=1 Tax=Streptomyces sp. E11-3 TaxID=3110112 RepID=UPI0039804966